MSLWADGFWAPGFWALNFWAGEAAADIEVPDCYDELLEDAIDLVEGVGLDYISQEVFHPTIAIGHVASQSPPAHTMVVSGTVVILRVSKGPGAGAPQSSFYGEYHYSRWLT